MAKSLKYESLKDHNGLLIKSHIPSSFVNVLAIFFIFSGAFFVGPVRVWFSSKYYEYGIITASDSIIPVISILTVIILILVRKGLFITKEFKFYLTAIYLLAAISLFSELVRDVYSDLFGFIFIINLLACVMWYGILSPQEKVIVFRWAIIIFFVYLIVNIFYWVFYLDPLGSPSFGLTYRRMGGSLATIVDLGIMIPALCAFYLAIYREGKNNYLKLLIITISIGSVIATGTRTGVLLMGILLSILIFSINNRSQLIRIFSFVIIGISLYIALSGLIVDYRFSVWDLSTEGRITSWYTALVYLADSGIFKSLFGSGWGQIYPYWDWLRAGGITWEGYNWFSMGLERSLVSPHNSLLWVLVEGGFFSMFVLTALLFYPFSMILREKKYQTKILIAFGVFSLLVMILIGDVLITSTGTTYFTIMLIFLSANYSKCVAEKYSSNYTL